ncbi:MAG: cysteine synthase B [Aquificaceae bacterium]|nr:cysteine synthase B [Aquificaceae bacterium]MDW8237714.1 cysteine synthase B [Aquificaceae bacterium]
MWVLGEHDEEYRKCRNSLLSLVGNTPLVKLSRCLPSDVPKSVEIYAKLEGFNPGGSVKDRPALSMFLDAIKRGLIKEGKTVIDATSGNTGIALAMVGSALGINVELAMPANVSEERKRIIRAFGAKVYLTDPMEGTDGAILFVRKLVKEEPEKFVYLDQYNNPANWRAHFYSTGVEIWHQTKGRITHLVAGVGTGGTLMGTSRRLRILNPAIQAIAVQPAYPFHGIEGLKHMESSIKPGIYDETQVDRTIFVETEPSYEMTKTLAQKEGILAGQSCGAALLGAIEIAKSLKEGVIVVILPDAGDRYLTTAPYKDLY